MEYAIIKFRENRTVLIDGEESGSTNETLTVDEGEHTFSLTGPLNYTPTEQTVNIKKTTEINPKEVVFE